MPLSTLHDVDELVRWAKDRRGIIHKVDPTCCMLPSSVDSRPWSRAAVFAVLVDQLKEMNLLGHD